MKFVVLLIKALFFIPQLKTAKINYLRIIGGRNATKGELPYVVELVDILRISKNSKIVHQRFCTGTVITARWTLTAAHCQVGFTKIAVKYWADIAMVSKFIVHPRYKQSTWNSIVDILNDIALLKHDVVHLKTFAKVSAIEYSALYGDAATIAAFGASARFIKKGYEKNTKNKLKVLYDNELPDGLQVLNGLIIKCDDRLFINLHPSICLAVTCDARPLVRVSAPGDSGSPLLHVSGIVGVLSSSMGIITEGQTYAGYYVPVSSFLRWIRNEIRADAEEDNTRILR